MALWLDCTKAGCETALQPCLYTFLPDIEWGSVQCSAGMNTTVFVQLYIHSFSIIDPWHFYLTGSQLFTINSRFLSCALMGCNSVRSVLRNSPSDSSLISWSSTNKRFFNVIVVTQSTINTSTINKHNNYESILCQCHYHQTARFHQYFNVDLTFIQHLVFSIDHNDVSDENLDQFNVFLLSGMFDLLLCRTTVMEGFGG